MKVLFDTNIILDVLLKRLPFGLEAKKLMDAVETSQLTGYLCATTITTIFYIHGKATSHQLAEDTIQKLLKLYNIALVDRGVLETALTLGYRDYEDAVLLEAAKKAGVDAIVTRNSKDFKKAAVRVYEPRDLLALFDS